jgi:polar amino acid transport system ATP-binding protein
MVLPCGCASSLQEISPNDKENDQALMLEVKQVSKSYGGTKVLKGIDLCVEPGKISVLIGPSGSGKTTLLKVLALLETPETGTVSVDGATYKFPLGKDVKIKTPWPKVTVVFQQLFLWPHLTLLQNMTLPLMAKHEDDDSARVHELIELFDMKDFVHRYPNQASLGQRQRAALVRALLLEPEYILLDEITSSLDVEQTAIILAQLKELRDKGIGILTITHLLQFAQDAADRVVFMDAGEVLEEGGPDLLINPSHERIRRFLSVVKAAS